MFLVMRLKLYSFVTKIPAFYIKFGKNFVKPLKITTLAGLCILGEGIKIANFIIFGIKVEHFG